VAPDMKVGGILSQSHMVLEKGASGKQKRREKIGAVSLKTKKRKCIKKEPQKGWGGRSRSAQGSKGEEKKDRGSS